ncbi:hypothetical protein [Paradevosia shaoguanensis]|uniref:Secreted protein n=1 Tax=Paradevosia shaoguanensis TaxID=1335043 RepID=A0AA41QQU5_9HYPH|nr:hypothetical protein [Paradevosia shaoguanensis]MCF1744626.1 hypothetical protein [Paradevosia shaoguanensis]MCI0129109.1 hypothetical protein [Paradevosia shaoguanensis]
MKLFRIFGLACVMALSALASPVLAAGVPLDLLAPSVSAQECVAPELSVMPASVLFVEARSDCDAIILDVAGICLHPVADAEVLQAPPEILAAPMSCSPLEGRSPG